MDINTHPPTHTDINTTLYFHISCKTNKGKGAHSKTTAAVSLRFVWYLN